MSEFKRILVPLDGSPLAERALPLATVLAQQFESQIILIRVVDFPDPIWSTPSREVAPDSALVTAHKQAIYQAKSYLQAQQGELREQGIDTKTLILENSPAEQIIDAAENEDVSMIIMSTHGRGGLARWAFGSIADKVMRHGPCPVLLVR